MLDTSIPEIEELLEYLTPDERKDVFALLEQDMANCMWRPLPGPQTLAYYCEADVLGYGGAAGGGKTDLMCGSALNRHSRSMLFRREYTQMKGIVQRMEEILGGKDGYGDKMWKLPDGRTIEFGSVPNLGDELKYQGRPRDLLGIDEAANFLRQQVVFLKGWVRTVDPRQTTQTIMTFNPPTTAEGRWVIDFFAPWLDDTYPIPAMPGELRWFATLAGEDMEVPDARRFVLGAGRELIYDYDPDEYSGVNATKIVRPESRTFIPSRIADNPFLVQTNYMSTLQALPEPLRSQMLYGDFKAGMTDDPWQVIPTKWVEDAQSRWRRREPKPEIISLGVDVARGGEDQSIIAGVAKDLWFDELVELPGSATPNGHSLGGIVIANNPFHAPIHIDVIGVGASPYDFLMQARQQVLGINVSERSVGTDKSGRLSFLNQRSELWWKFRELLDPANNHAVALPPGRDLLIELTAPKWTLQGAVIKVESREEIVARIGRSPDRATAVILASIRTPKALPGRDGIGAHSRSRRGYDPLNRKGYDPFEQR